MRRVSRDNLGEIEARKLKSLSKKSMMDEVAVYHARIEGRLPARRNKITLIDLFSGAGGLTLGFTDVFGHSFLPIWANDFNAFAAASYNANFGNHCIVGDIVDILDNENVKIPKADLIIGGPPCQGFSLLNKNRAYDARKELWMPFFEVIKRSGASIFVMENVPQLLGSYEYTQIAETASRLGFMLADAKLCAADYGVAQLRWRAFIVGCKFADPNIVFPPKKTNWNPNNGYSDLPFNNYSEYVADAQPWRALRDVLADLPSPKGTELRDVPPPMNLHFGRTPTAVSLKRYKAIPKEGMNRFDLQKNAPQLTPDCWIRKKTGGTDLFGRLWWDKPAFTIRTEFFKPEKGRYLHPFDHRPITHREAARLQSFPDSYRFIGNKIEIAKQIGNAVPPLLASRIADSIYALFAYRRGK